MIKILAHYIPHPLWFIPSQGKGELRKYLKDMKFLTLHTQMM